MSDIRHTAWIYVVGLGHALSTTLLWIWLVKILDDEKAIFEHGAIWDAAMYIPAIFIPFLCFGVKISLTSAIGFGIMILGAIIFMIGKF